MAGSDENFPPIPVELAKEIARQGELRLAAITSMASAADGRATTCCGFFVAASIALAGAVLTHAVSGHPVLGLILAGSSVSIGMFISAIIFFKAIIPQDFFISGGNPDIL